VPDVAAVAEAAPRVPAEIQEGRGLPLSTTSGRRLSPDPGRGGVGRWAAVDIDAHTDADDAGRNGRYALHLYRRLANLGTGGYHLWVFFDRHPWAVLFAFGRWLIMDERLQVPPQG